MASIDFSPVKAGDVDSTLRIFGKAPGRFDTRDQFDQTPMHISAWHGHLGLVQALIAFGADVNATDKNQYTPLLAAASSAERTISHVIICEILLRKGANPNATTAAGTSVLHYLVRFPPSPHLHILLELLVELGADIDVRDANDETPLQQAAFRGNDETIEYLILKGAGLDNINKIGETALHMASRAGKSEVVRMLLNYDADPTIESENGSARDVAFLCNQQSIVDLFDEYEHNAAEGYRAFMGADDGLLTLAATANHTAHTAHAQTDTDVSSLSASSSSSAASSSSSPSPSSPSSSTTSGSAFDPPTLGDTEISASSGSGSSISLGSIGGSRRGSRLRGLTGRVDSPGLETSKSMSGLQIEGGVTTVVPGHSVEITKPSRFGALQMGLSVDFGPVVDTSKARSQSVTARGSTSTGVLPARPRLTDIPVSPLHMNKRLSVLNSFVIPGDASAVYGLQYTDESPSPDGTVQRIHSQRSTPNRFLNSHPSFNLELGTRVRTSVSATAATEGEALPIVYPSDVSLEYSDEHDSLWYTEEFVRPGRQPIEPKLRKCLLTDDDFKPHLNLYGNLDNSRVVVSLLLEPNQHGEFRVIIRRATGDKIMFISPRDLQVKHTDKKKFIKHLLQLLSNKIEHLSDLVIADDLAFKRSLVELDLILKIRKYKFGVVCVRAGMSEDDIFAHDEYPQTFLDFLDFLGPKILLNGWTKYRGDLDVKNGGTGTHAHYTLLNDMEIIFQSTSLLPQIRRKPIIGNSIATIVFLESGTFDPSLIVSQVLHVFIVIQPVIRPEGVFYRVGTASKKGVPRYRPTLVQPAIYPPTPEFRQFLLHKLVNGERASYHCFSKTPTQKRSLVEIVQQTRVGQMEFAISNLPTDTKRPKSSFSLADIIRRKKDPTASVGSSVK